MSELTLFNEVQSRFFGTSIEICFLPRKGILDFYDIEIKENVLSISPKFDYKNVRMKLIRDNYYVAFGNGEYVTIGYSTNERSPEPCTLELYIDDKLTDYTTFVW